MKKYEFTGETKEIVLPYRNAVLHRIRAITDFGTVKVGDLGGWIEKEENLSHEGNAWVRGDAWVYDNAWVYGNAVVRGNALVRGDAEIFLTSQVLTIGPIGSRNGFTTFYRDKDNEITVKCGCFLGKMEQFREKVEQTHGDSKHGQVYRAAAEMAKIQIDLEPENR